MGLWPGSRTEQQLKVASLYYDRAILPIRQGHFEGVLGVFREQDRLSERSIKLLRSAWSPCDYYIPPEQVDLFKRIVLNDDEFAPELTYRGHITAADEAIREVSGMSQRSLYQAKKNDRIAYFRELNGTLTSAEGGARAWLFLQQYAPCALIAFHRIEQIALIDLVNEAPVGKGSTEQPVVEEAEKLLHPVEMLVPRVSELPWDILLRMRRDRRVKDFRRWLAVESQKTGQLNKDSMHYAVDALWDAFGELKVNVGSEVLQGIVANLPLPMPINPFGLAISVKDVIGAVKFRRRFGWLSFLHKLNKVSVRMRN